MRKHEKKCSVYVGFIDLEKTYNRVNREVLWQVLRMYYVGDGEDRDRESERVRIETGRRRR